MKCNHHIIVRDQQLRSRAVDLVRDLPLEPMQEVIIRDYRKDKTLAQLGYLFGVVFTEIQKHIEDSQGDFYTTEELYDWFIDEYGESRVVTLHGKPKVVKLTASGMNTKEMSEFTERVIMHAAEHMGLAISPPEERRYG
jgi:hypothetical protein